METKSEKLYLLVILEKEFFVLEFSFLLTFEYGW